MVQRIGVKMMMMITIIIIKKLFQYCHMTTFTYNNSSHYILLTECIYSVFMLIHF
jgi:hypothetical protein